MFGVLAHRQPTSAFFLSRVTHDSVVNFPFTKRGSVVTFVTVKQKSHWTGGPAAEGTGMLNRRTGYTGTAGFNLIEYLLILLINASI